MRRHPGPNPPKALRGRHAGCARLFIKLEKRSRPERFSGAQEFYALPAWPHAQRNSRGPHHPRRREDAAGDRASHRRRLTNGPAEFREDRGDLPKVEEEMMDALSEMQYPHWLMVAGAILVVLGFIGLAFHRNRNAEPDHKSPEVKANGK